MKAIVKPKPKPGQEWPKGMLLTEKPEPTIEDPNDVIIKVFAGGICGTDVGIYNSKSSLQKEMLHAVDDPVTIGHEFSGTIVDAGKQARVHLARLMIRKAKTNRDVRAMVRRKTPSALASEPGFLRMLEKKFFGTAEMHVTCGTCYQCSLGEYHVCRNTIIQGLHNDGAWAEYVKVPARNVRLFYGREIPPEIISFMDALGNGTHTVFSAPVRDRSVAILGLGVQGLLAVAVAKSAGAKRIYVTDASRDHYPHEKLVNHRFALAKSFGADHCFDVAMADERHRFVDTILGETDQTGVDAVFEMSGNYNAYIDAAKVLRMGGVFSLLGLPSGTIEVDFAKNIIFRGITVHGIIGRKVFQTWDQMEVLLREGMAKKLMASGIVSHQIPLEKFDEGFAAIKAGDAFKVLLKP
ncbi:MAG: zinc-binding dehydrogenase [Ignavibacteria bacterium]|nr:zinc-binding dehydrogenase [Ignavibacteria bacterium]